MEPLVTIIKGWKMLIITTKSSILDLAAVLDPGWLSRNQQSSFIMMQIQIARKYKSNFMTH